MSKDFRGWCGSCEELTVRQSRDLRHLENSCPKSKGEMKLRCGMWKRRTNEHIEEEENGSKSAEQDDMEDELKRTIKTTGVANGCVRK